jgi:hypothetical protein
MAASALTVFGGWMWNAMQPQVVAKWKRSTAPSMCADRAGSIARRASSGHDGRGGESLMSAQTAAYCCDLPDLSVRFAANPRASRGGRRNRVTKVRHSSMQLGGEYATAHRDPHGVVTHLGTQYLVRTGRTGVEVAVREGRAQLKTARRSRWRRPATG